MRSYKHSQSFAQLKTLTENIQGNHTSSQYVEVLDFMLYQAVEPLQQTSLYLHWLPQVLAWYNTNSSRKISSVDRQQLQTLICMYLVAPVDKRITVIKKLRLERNLLTLVIDDFLAMCISYRQLVEQYTAQPENRPALGIQIKAIEQHVGIEPGTDLYSMYQHVNTWYMYYLEFRGHVVEKFTRLALMKAKETYVLLGHALDLDDVIQHYLMAIGKAVDKFDVGLGSLASYVGQWFLNARSECRKDLGQQHQSLDELSDSGIEAVEVDDVFETVARNQQVARIRLLARIADPAGLARLTLGIEEAVK